MTLCNNYSLRTAKDQRNCFICGKLTNAVFDAPDDFFFICLSHTKDTEFCTSSVTQIAKKDNEDDEIEKLKKEINELKEQLADKNKDGEASEAKKKPDSKDKKEPEIKEETVREGPKSYKLHRSFLYLREQEKIKKEKMNILKNLK